VLAIRRGEQMLSNPDGNMVLHSGDLLVALSEPGKLARFAQHLLDGQSGEGEKACSLPLDAGSDPAPEKEMP